MKNNLHNPGMKIFLMIIMGLISIITKGQLPSDIGAKIPWKSYEAEDSKTDGKILSGRDDRSKATYEASGRALVELVAPGSFVSFRSTVKANRITLRYSLPKGTNGSVELLINNKKKQDIPLSSERIWKRKADYPGGMFRFFDETIVEADVKPGDEIRLVRGTAEGCMIDFIDLEMTPRPLSKPDKTWLDVTAFGATGNDESDDTKAIRDCIDAARAGSKKVWIPAGNYYITDQVNVLKGIQISGAGMWHTVVKKNIPATKNVRAFQMADSTAILNLKLDDIAANVRINGHEGIRFSSSSKVLIDGVWVANTFGAGILGAHANNITIRNCRVFGTYADAIHVARQSYNVLAENNLVRNSGDDGLAIVTYASTGCHDIVYRNNTVWFNYSGRGITMIGGDRNILEKNLVIDGTRAGLLIAAEVYNKQITPYVTNFLVQNNRLIRCGDIVSMVRQGISIWGNIETSPLSGIVRNNEIIDPVRHAISVHNWVPKEVIIENNIIDDPGPGCQRFFTDDLKPGVSPVFRGNKEVSLNQ